LVLLDLGMPVMGGDVLAPVLREKYPSLRIVVSSGYAEEGARESIPMESVSGFLHKPYTAMTIANKIAEALGSPPSAPS
jgi:CheY-like chemotaxis protein